MKKITAIVISLFIIIFFAASLRAANYKSLAKDDIGDAKKAEDKMVKDKDLQDYIPYALYHEAKNYLKDAAFQYDDKSEYELSSYFAVLSKISFETARVVAETRLMKNKLLLAEMDTYKNAAREEMLKAAIQGAGLAKKGKSYITNVEDGKMFKAGSLVVLPGGEDVLNKIYQVTKLYPQSKLLIKGHTRLRDKDNANSRLKAEKISEFFVMNKGMDQARIEVKGVGDQEPMDVGGRDKKVDRVEIIILGVD